MSVSRFPEGHRPPPVARGDWEAEADRWLLTARKYAAGDGALICPPGPPSQSGFLSDGIEGFARSFLIAGARLGGASDGDPHGHAQWYADGLAAAMTCGGRGSWPRAIAAADYPSGGLTQPAVEAANLVFGLALCREQVWDVLEDSVRERLTEWLAYHARLKVWDNNWVLFTAIVEAFLESVGADVAGGRGAEGVEQVESWYLGDGWYNDGPPAGPGRNIDHYNSWVIHPFLWQWYTLRGNAEPAWRVARFRERLGAFASSYSLLFAPDGAPLHQGRSLTYRHAVLGGLWTAGLAGVDPLPAGELRGIAGRTLRYFQGLGVDGATAPSLGWGAEQFLPSVQEYSGPGSTYFAGMGFLGLAASADHPLWADGELPAEHPSAGTDSVTNLGAIGWLVQHDRRDGIVRVVNHGSDHALSANDLGDPHYAKFAYSTHTAPGTGTAWGDRAWVEGIDGHVALVDEWGRSTRRGPILGTCSGEGIAASWHLPRLHPSGEPLTGARIVTASIVDGVYELRCHLVTAPEGWRVREGGDAVAGDVMTGLGDLSVSGGLSMAPDTLSSGVLDPTIAHPCPPPRPFAWACGNDIRSSVLGIHGYDAGCGAVIQHTGANTFGHVSAAPYLITSRAGDAASVHIALHLLDRTPAEASDLPDPATIATVTVAGSVVRANWANGATTVVDLDALFS